MPKKDRIRVHVRLDASGLSRPLPVLKVKKAIDAMAPGEVLEVTATSQGGPGDISLYAGRLGHEILGAWVAQNRCRFIIRKSAGEA